ncbi:hypothetical protein ACEPAI_6940 [Sanghuangporus weigelae]
MSLKRSNSSDMIDRALVNLQIHDDVSQNGTNRVAQQRANSSFHETLGQPQRQQTGSGPTTQQQQMLQAFLQQQSSDQSLPPSLAPALEAQETQHRPNSLSFPPLARERFMGLLQEWWKRSGINFNPRMITIGNRQIDINQLHQLHTEVLQFGGVVNVQRDDLWNVIAAKMGWTAAAISESGHTQDQIAEQIKVIYERLLQSFEQTYMSAAMKHSLTAQQQQPLDHQIAPNQPSSGPNQPPLADQQAVKMIKLASMSAEQLRANGYPENLIQSIERSRPQLEATWRKMQMQRIQAAQQQQQQLQQQGALLNAPLPFQNQLQAQASLHNRSSLPTEGGLPNANTLGHPGFSAGCSQSTEFPGQQRSGLNASQLTQQNIQMFGMLSNLNLRRPTPEMVKQATSTIDQLKQDVSKERTFRPEHVRHLSDAEKGVFPGQFENLCNVIRDISRFYHVYLAATSDLPLIRGIIKMLDMCDKQRRLVQSANPVYVLDISALQRLTKTAVEVKSKISAALRAMLQMEQNQALTALARQGESGPAHPPLIQQSQSPTNIAPSPAPIPPRPPTMNIKTPDQAAQFYNDMTQILELSNDTALPPELYDTLAQSVKTVGFGLEVPDATGSSSVGLLNGGTSSAKVADRDDNFFCFLDYTEDEKADTPELVPAFSTNAGPEYGAGSETVPPPTPATSGSVGDRAKIIDSFESEPKTGLFDTGELIFYGLNSGVKLMEANQVISILPTCEIRIVLGIILGFPHRYATFLRVYAATSSKLSIFSSYRSIGFSTSHFAVPVTPIYLVFLSSI